MSDLDRERTTRGKKRADGARLIVQSLANLAHRHGLVLDEVNWVTHPSEEAAVETYTLLISSQRRLEELVFLRQELECLPHSAYTRRRIDRLLRWLVDALSA